jgi:hypothetical protein
VVIEVADEEGDDVISLGSVAAPPRTVVLHLPRAVRAARLLRTAHEVRHAAESGDRRRPTTRDHHRPVVPDALHPWTQSPNPRLRASEGENTLRDQ